MIRLSVSSNFANKDNRADLRPDKRTGEKSNTWAYGAFNNVTMPTNVIAKHLTSGKAICIAALTTNWRKSENFVSAQLMGIDFDQSPGVDALLEDAFVAEYAFLVYPTASHTAQAPRSRILFALDTPITDVEAFTRLIKRLMHRFNRPVDEACKDVVRIFYGSTQAGFVMHEAARLPVRVLEALPEHPDELKPNVAERQATAITDYDLRKRAEKYSLAAKQKIMDAALATPAGADLRHAAFNGAAMAAVAKAKAGWPGFEGVDGDLRWLGLQMGRDEDEIARSIRGAWDKADSEPLVLSENGNGKPPAAHSQDAPVEPKERTSSPQERHNEPEIIPPAIVWRTSDEGMRRYREGLKTARTNGSMPLIFPFKALWEFGGFARILDAGILVGVVGMSGGLKTSFLETITDAWRQMDASDVLWWGTEWTLDGMSARAVQRYGGVRIDDKALHDLWLIEEQQGIAPAARYGVRLSDSTINTSAHISEIIEGWGGRSHQVDDPVTDVDVLLALFADRLSEQSAAGRRVRVCVWDYVQLLDLYSARSESEKISSLLGKLKMFCIEHKVIGLVASQVTKSSSGAAKSGDDVLQAESGQFFRSDKFNLVLTLNPIYDGKLLTNRGVINVAKNSTGKTGVQTVYIDPSKFKWIDKKAPENQQVSVNDLETDIEF